MLGDGPYALRVSAERPPLTPFTIDLDVDGTVGTLSYQVDKNGGRPYGAFLRRTPRSCAGLHSVSLVNG
ncbi:MAG: hypothetical protein R2748_08215 [Bryobacterales bacterium]